jgi:dihydroorotase
MRSLLSLIVFILLSGPVAAQTYDLLIKGGTVYDPVLVGVRDVGIKNGLVTAIETSIDPETATTVYDATGKTVVPGLVDLHSHCNSSGWPLSTLGVNCDAVAATRGYTTMATVGDVGWPDAATFRASQAGKTTRMLGFLNIGWRGMINGWEYATNPPVLAPTAVCPSGAITRADIEVCETAGVLAANWQFFAGIKVRMSYFLIGSTGMQVLQMALDAATKAELYSGHHFPIMVHIGSLETPTTIDAIVSMLRAGDAVTHPYTEWAHYVSGSYAFAQAGSCANHSAAAAVAKGIIIDLGSSSGATYGNNAFGPLSYVICGKIGIAPHSLSDDTFNASSALYSMTDMASILLGLNNGNNISPLPPAAFQGPIQTALTLSDVIYKMTRGPALVLGDRVPALTGTLQVGSPGDVAVLNVQSGSFAYPICSVLCSTTWTITSPTKIDVVKTIKGGALL